MVQIHYLELKLYHNNYIYNDLDKIGYSFRGNNFTQNAAGVAQYTISGLEKDGVYIVSLVGRVHSNQCTRLFLSISANLKNYINGNSPAISLFQDLSSNYNTSVYPASNIVALISDSTEFTVDLSFNITASCDIFYYVVRIK